MIVKRDELKAYGDKLLIRIEELEKNIYEAAGCEFNINSPKQLGEILFEDLNLPHGKKQGRNGYPTDHDTLVKIIDTHPVIPLILEHRNLNKIMNTYMDSLKKYIRDDKSMVFKFSTTKYNEFFISIFNK